MKKLRFLLFIALILNLNSCVKERFQIRTEDNRISFISNLSDPLTVNVTRSGKTYKDSCTERAVAKLKGKSKTYLHLLITDNNKLNNISAKKNTKTRANPTTDPTEDFSSKYTTLNIYGYKYKFNQFSSENNAPHELFIDNLTASKSSSLGNKNIYNLPEAIYYPGPKYKMDIIALAPSDIKSNTSINPETKNVNISVNTENQDELKDIFISTNNGISGSYRNEPFELEFKHLLSAIKFEVGDNLYACTIKSVKILNLKTSGKYDPISGKWDFGSSPSSSITKVYNYKQADDNLNNTNYASLNPKGDDKNIMIIPQELNNIQFEILCNDGLTDYTLTSPTMADILKLKNNEKQSFEANKIYTFRISNVSAKWIYVFKVDFNINPLIHDNANYPIPDNENYAQVPYYGLGEKKFVKCTIASYKYNKYDGVTINGKDTLVQYKHPIEFDKTSKQKLITIKDKKVTEFNIPGYNYNVEVPVVFKDEKSLENGAITTYKVMCMAFCPQNESHKKLMSEDQHNKIWGYNANTVYDLSQQDGIGGANGLSIPWNTANCYIINTYGRYEFPLVFGNAIKNGNTYENSYKDKNGYDSKLENLVDYRSYNIGTPYIKRQLQQEGRTIASAEVLWD